MYSVVGCMSFAMKWMYVFTANLIKQNSEMIAEIVIAIVNLIVIFSPSYMANLYIY